MNNNYDFHILGRITACPKCKTHIHLQPGSDATCELCNIVYPFENGAWNFILSAFKAESPLWSVWEVVQANGMAGYSNDPEHNLAVGQRKDCADFAEFCGCKGLILDVGCGPQAWPAYFIPCDKTARYIGVDPMANPIDADYLQFKALGEHLPLCGGLFDHVLFATSLDHFIDPRKPLEEAKRVMKPNGQINLWVSEKSPATPKPNISPSWYQKLSKPELAEDLFHLKRWSYPELVETIDECGLNIKQCDIRNVDSYRKNIFIRLHKVLKN